MSHVYSEADIDDIAEGRCLFCDLVDEHRPDCPHAGGLGEARGDEVCSECARGFAVGEPYLAESDVTCLPCAVLADL